MASRRRLDELRRERARSLKQERARLPVSARESAEHAPREREPGIRTMFAIEPASEARTRFFVIDLAHACSPDTPLRASRAEGGQSGLNLLMLGSKMKQI